MQQHFGSNKNDIEAFLGPSICPEHYQVPKEMRLDFIKQTSVSQPSGSIDLKYTILEQLNRLNISKIISSPICTYEDESYFSYRRNHTNQRQVSIIGLCDDR